MAFVRQWALAMALMPFLIAALLTAIAAPFATGSPGAWAGPFYGRTLQAVVASPKMWLLILALGLVSAQLGRVANGGKRGG